MARNVLGMEFAPLSVPLPRRLQTLAAVVATWLFFFGGISGGIFILYLLHTKYYWVSFLYLAWMWYDRDTSSRGGRPIQMARTARMYHYLRDYFPMKLIKTAELDHNQNYVFGYHPHGVMGVGTINFVSEATNIGKLFPGIRFTVLTLKLLHYLPFYREYISAMGYCDVSKESISYLFRQKGSAVVILIGGAKESLDASPKKTCVVLKERKGFVKVALKHGAYLCPVYTFGENDIFRLALDNRPGSRVRKIQRLFQKVVGYAPIVVVGRGIFNYTFGFVPYRVPVISVVGRPIPVGKDENPTQDKINELHQRYMKELKELFDENKAKYGYQDQTLEFIE